MPDPGSTDRPTPRPDGSEFESASGSQARAAPLLRELLREPAHAPWSPPAEVGDFVLGDELGRGGMGVVYAARQRHPDRDVALKVVHPAAFGDDGWRRFEREIEVLGRLRHPNIVPILQAGRLPGGEPWFAMERIDGRRLDDWLTARRPELTTRLELFLQVADAVDHAHEQGVVHRDLKPANVLVDDADQPHLIDFGLARQLERTHGATLTASGAIAGSVPYMAPEQARGDVDDISPRTDVYGLGALLFHLLCGRPPHDLPPDTPLPRALDRVAGHPADTPRRVDPSVPQALDWVVGRALAHHPTRRYSGAAAIADDVRRVLALEPTAAGPRGRWESVSLFLRRHRGTVLAVAPVVVALAAVGLALWEARDDRAEALAEAAGRTTLAEQSLDTLARLTLAGSGLTEADAARTLALVDTAVALQREALVGRPVALADQLTALAESLAKADLHARAASLLGEAVDLLWHERSAPPPTEALAALLLLGDAHHSLGDVDSARATWTLVRDNAPERFAAGDERDLVMANALANAARETGDPDGALDLIAAARQRARPDADPMLLVRLGETEAVLHFDAGRTAEAFSGFQDVFERTQARHGWAHPLTLGATRNLAACIARVGGSGCDELLAFWDQCATALRSSVGGDHPQLGEALVARAPIHRRRGDLERALGDWWQVVDMSRALPDDRATALDNLTIQAFRAGEYELALTLAEAAVDRPTGARDLFSERWVAGLHSLSVVESTLQRGDSLGLQSLLYATRCQDPGPTHADTLTTGHTLATCWFRAGRPDTAIDLMEEVAWQRLQTLGARDRFTLSSWSGLAQLLVHEERWGEALAAATRALSMDPGGETARLRSLRGAALIGLGRDAEGLAELGAAVPALAAEHEASARMWMARGLEREGRRSEALREARRSFELTADDHARREDRRQLVERLAGDG